jgi:hypothetical protein
MNATDRATLQKWAVLVEEYVMPPRPSGGSGDWEKEYKAFAELQRDRAIHISSDMRYLTGKSGLDEPGYPPDPMTVLQIFIRRMRKELAEPLPYTVKPGAGE